jgi:hypothetical protein
LRVENGNLSPALSSDGVGESWDMAFQSRWQERTDVLRVAWASCFRETKP